jgi:hypothetical protein
VPCPHPLQEKPLAVNEGLAAATAVVSISLDVGKIRYCAASFCYCALTKLPVQ